MNLRTRWDRMWDRRLQADHPLYVRHRTPRPRPSRQVRTRRALSAWSVFLSVFAILSLLLLGGLAAVGFSDQYKGLGLLIAVAWLPILPAAMFVDVVMDPSAWNAPRHARPRRRNR